MTTKRIASKTVTDTLARAMENADRFKNVIIIAETHPGDECSQLLFLDAECTLAATNYLVDILKQYLVTVPRSAFEATPDDAPEDPEEDDV